MKMSRVITAVFLAIGLLLYNVSAAWAMPPIPSSFYGTVKLDGANVPVGTVITARINGVTYASVSADTYLGDTVYFFDVPGDDPDTSGVIEGGVSGNTIVFYIGSYIADQTAPWQSGTSVELNLTGSTYRTVTFNANGGSGTMSPQTANVPTALTSNAYTRLGYSFTGWNTNAGGTGTAYANGATYSFADNVTLYAQWVALPNHTVTFNANGGSGTMSPQVTNIPTALTSNAFTRTGYAFANWNTQAGGGGSSYADGATYDFSADLALHAQWTANTYTVTFNANGGSSPTPTSKIVTFDSAYGTLATTSRTGYAFAGWFTAASGGTEVTAASIVATASNHTLYAHWTANTYTVTFDANGGSSPTPTSKVVTFGSTYGTLATTSRTGFTFNGWFTAASGGTEVTSATTVTNASNHTLYAQWTVLPNHTVTFNANSGTGTMTPQVTNVPTALTLNTFTRTGYAFAGWNTNAGGTGTAYTDGATYSFAADITLYAQWTANTYTATFDGNGGNAPTPATKVVTFGSAYGTLATTSRTGYTFDGWFTAASGGTEVTAATIVTNASNHTLYAHWTVLPNHTVTFLANGGTGTMAPQVTNIPTALTSNAFTRAGYTFANWNTLADGTGTAYANGSTYSFAADVTLYAQWTANTYTVTFDGNDGSSPTPATKVVTFGSAYGTLATTSRTGYTFAGWFTAVSGGTEVTAATVVTNASNHTLYAHWTANTYTATFNANGGNTPVPTTKVVTFGSAYGTLATTSRTGYTFDGWFTSASGGTEVTEATVVATASNHTLYAHWTVLPTHTVTFNANSGTGTMAPQVTNVPTALTLNTFTRTGYTFAGWNTNAGGTGTAYADGATYSFAADITLYAQWTAIPTHTVTFNANSGTGTMAPQVTNVPTALTLNTFTRTGYTFANWNTAANGSGTAYANGATYSFAADMTLYAQWTANTYTVTFNANGGTTPAPASKVVTFGATYGTLATTSRTGYNFLGWFTSASGGTQVTSSTVVTNASNHTLYAQWTTLPIHTVTFSANSGTGTMDPQTANIPTALTANAFTRDGYWFSGWNTNAGGTGTAYADGATYSFAADVTLYAQWTQVAAITVTGISANNKVYDGNATATLNTSGYSFVGVAGGDVVTLVTAGATASFDNENVGTGKPVAVTGLGLGGADAYKYTLTQPTLAANITARDLTVTAVGVNKVYDGTVSATATLSSNPLVGDTVTATYVSAEFGSKDVGVGKTVTVNDIAIGGSDAGNYHLLNTTAAATADITPAQLTVTADNQTVVVGNPDPTFTYAVSGFIAPDVFVTAPTCTVADPHTVAGAYDIACSGGDAGANYEIAYVKGVLTVSAANNPPTDVALTNSSVNENMPAGTPVGVLSGIDPDASDVLSFSFACAAPGADDASFQIVGVSLNTAVAFDYETKNSYAICVRVEDGHGGYFDENFAITVKNVVERITLIIRSTSTQDGWVLESGENTLRGGTMNSGVSTLRVGDDAARKQYRSVLSFATGPVLPDTAVITKLTLKVKRQSVTGGGDPLSTFQGFMLDIRKGFFGTTALQVTDWQATASKTVGPFNPTLTAGWYSIDLTGYRNFVNKFKTSGGLTQVRLRFKLDDNNNAVANYLSLFSGNAALASRPQLIVEYYVP